MLELYSLGHARSGSSCLWDVIRYIERHSDSIKLVNKKIIKEKRKRGYFKDDYESLWKDQPYSPSLKLNENRIAVASYRDIRDSLVSLYYYIKKTDHPTQKYIEGMSEEGAYHFLITSRGGIPRFTNFFFDWYRREHTHMVSFDTITNPEFFKVYLQSIFSNYGVEIPEDIIGEAIYKHTYEKRCKIRQANMGKNRSYKDHLKEAHLTRIHEIYNIFFKLTGYEM